MNAYKKAAIDLIIFALCLVLLVVTFRYFLAPAVDMEEQARVSHAKRLFGDAWKESMRYD